MCLPSLHILKVPLLQIQLEETPQNVTTPGTKSADHFCRIRAQGTTILPLDGAAAGLLEMMSAQARGIKQQG